MGKYSIELKNAICHDYVAGKFGYKKLAKKYGLNRDTVRWIVLNHSYIQGQESLEDLYPDMKFKDKDEELEFYKCAAAYWRNFAEISEELDPGLKKKRQQKLSELQSKETDSKSE